MNEILKSIVKILDDKKAEDIEILNIHDSSTIADYFVICSGNSSTHVKTLQGEIETMLADINNPVSHTEGARWGNWILLDCGSVVVHIFQKEMRDYYKLERLWADSEKLPMSQILDQK